MTLKLSEMEKRCKGLKEWPELINQTHQAHLDIVTQIETPALIAWAKRVREAMARIVERSDNELGPVNVELEQLLEEVQP